MGIQIPQQCLTDQGMNFTRTLAEFYEEGNARDHSNVLVCKTNDVFPTHRGWCTAFQKAWACHPHCDLHLSPA
jgi:hypothetical protein